MKQIASFLQTCLFCTLLLTLAVSVFILLESFYFPVTYTAVDLIPLPTTSTVAADALKLPLLLTIPRIGVEAEIQPVGLAQGDSGEMAAPSNFTDVGWYKDGTFPGHPGSAVMTGHLSGRNVPQAVFYDLGKLAVDDLLFVTDTNGSRLTFTIVAIKTFQYNDSAEEVFLSNDKIARLNLITCSGTWLSDVRLFEERIVVFSELVTTE